MVISISVWASLLLLAVTLVVWSLSSRKSRIPLPPGPPRTFILGNAHELKPSHNWLYYTELARKYGDVVSVDVLGQPLISLNTYEACYDLLVKKSSVYQGRPHLTFCGELVGWDGTIGLAEGPTWQLYRKLTNQFLGPKATTAYYSLIEKETHALALRMLSTSESFVKEFRFGLTRTVLDMTYGIRAKDKNDPFVVAADHAVITFGEATEPGKWLVDVLPILKYLPTWFPYAEFQRIAKEWRLVVDESVNRPFQTVKANLAAGTATPSFTSQALENPPPGVTDPIIRWASGSLYAASVDTITSTMSTFVLNMLLHPEIQAKAQAELDQVVGKDRLPTFEDRPKLPYLEAILKESMRIHPPVPMGVPYKALDDAQYRDWHIPKNAILMANLWAIVRDPKMYPEPERFNPERFLQPNVLDPHQYFFGFGRRICPGQYLADVELWISMATMLATFDFSKDKDAQGHDITPSMGYTGSMICEPLHFKHKVSPRSDAAINLIHDVNIE